MKAAQPAVTAASTSIARPSGSAAFLTPSWRACCTDCTKRVHPLVGLGAPARVGTLTQAPFLGLAPPFSLTGFPTPGSYSPYSQIPKLAPNSEVRFPKPYTSSHPWPRTNQRQRNPGGSTREGWGPGGGVEPGAAST